MTHPLAEEYALTCQHEGCNGIRIISEVGSAGFVLGSMVQRSSEDPDRGRCLRCKRYTMKVTEVPPPFDPPKPEGFTRIPTQ